MGTRNLVEVVKNGELKVSQYGQWDGYPTGQGAVIAKFLHEKMQKEQFLNALDNLSWDTPKDEEARMKSLEQAFPDMDVKSGWLTIEQGDWWNKNFPELSRDTCADILEVIQEKDGKIKLVNSSDFKEDTPFCEYHYIIDMDNETVSMRGHKETITLPFSEWTEEKMKELEDNGF